LDVTLCFVVLYRLPCCLLIACLTYSTTPKMEAVRSSETSVNVSQTKWRHILDDSTFSPPGEPQLHTKVQHQSFESLVAENGSGLWRGLTVRATNFVDATRTRRPVLCACGPSGRGGLGTAHREYLCTLPAIYMAVSNVMPRPV
jgi:hypothetical protein